jgi:hypothetical protein
MLVIVLVFSIVFTLFFWSNYGVFLGSAGFPNGPASFVFSKTSNMTTPKMGDVFEISVNVTWRCYGSSQVEQIVELVDPYPEDNCRLIGGNNVIQCSGYDEKAKITYLLEVIDDNPETFMLSNPFTATYVDGTEVHRPRPP